MLPSLLAIVGVVLVAYGVRLVVDPAYRERVDVRRPGFLISPADRLWFRGPATRPARDEMWKRAGWAVVVMGAFTLIVGVVFIIR